MQDRKNVPFLRGPGKGRLWGGKNKALTTQLVSVSLASLYSSQLSPVWHADAYVGGRWSLKEEQGRRESQTQALKGALRPRKMASIGIFAVMQQHEWEECKQEALLFLGRSPPPITPSYHFTIEHLGDTPDESWEADFPGLALCTIAPDYSRLFWVLRTHKKGGAH